MCQLAAEVLDRLPLLFLVTHEGLALWLEEVRGLDYDEAVVPSLDLARDLAQLIAGGLLARCRPFECPPSSRPEVPGRRPLRGSVPRCLSCLSALVSHIVVDCLSVRLMHRGRLQHWTTPRSSPART